jgi:hypothetical protein
MADQEFYCAKASLDAGERCFGTAVNADIWLLIENSEPWGRNAVKDSSIPAAVKEHLASLSRTSKRIRVQLIKQASRTSWPRKMFVAFTPQTGAHMLAVQLSSYEDLLRLTADDLLEQKVALDNRPCSSPLYLVCTHGVHDKCCAKFGFATYKFMRGIDADNVWQTTHVGGDRFASNVITFPTGVYYGHVDDRSARAIIEAETNGRIFLERYRGRTCFGPHGQVAEYFVRRESGIRDANLLRREWVRPNEERTEWTGVFTSDSGRIRHNVTFSQRRSAFASRLTCHAVEEKSPMEYTLINYTEDVSIDLPDANQVK